MTEKKDKTPRKTVRKKKNPEKDFALLAEKFKERKPVRYRMSGSFEVDDVIDHNAFGKGIVIDTSYKKIGVVFSDKLRILVCNR